MKLLITGASYGIGAYMCNYFKDKFDIIPCSKVNEGLISEIPDAVIHAYEISDINCCERNEKLSYIENTIETKKAASICSKLNIPIIYISTAHVFSGEKIGPYEENDSCNPINIYGKTKLYGEQLVRTLCTKYFILRTSSILGVSHCFVKNIIKNNTLPIFQYSKETSSPIFIEDICQLTEAMLNSTCYGIYHCTNNNYLTTEELTELILKTANIKRNIVYIPRNIVSNSARVAKNTALCTNITYETYKIKPSSLEERLRSYIYSIL